MGFDAFEAEKKIIKRAEELLSEDETCQDFRSVFEALLKDYKKLFKISSRLIRMSDRNEHKLKVAEEALSRANERMESELNVGREIQMKMVPFNFDAYKEHQEFSIFAVLEPAREVGGDFYDFFFIDEDWLCINVGDVSGKGVPAALFMAVTKTMIKTRAADDYSPASIITHVNDELSIDNPSSMFVTLFVGLLNIKTGEFIYSNAGHNPPYIKHHSGRLEILDQRHGPVIGAMDELAYKEDKVILAKGDTLLMFTDGVTEAMDINKQLYGDRRLSDWFQSHNSGSVENLVRDILLNVNEFSGEAEQADDITILAVEFSGQVEVEKSQILGFFIKNQLPEIEVVNKRFKKFARQCSIPECDTRRIYIVFDEILTNIISYAYTDKDEHEIEIKLECSGKRLAVTISDDGIPFNPFSSAIPDTSLKVEERNIGGLGIHLVRNIMDEVSYQRRIDKNVVMLVKYIDQSGQ